MKNFFKTLFALGALYATYQTGWMVGCCSTVNAFNGFAELTEAVERAEEVLKAEQEAK